MLMSLYDDEEPMYANASLANLKFLRRNMKDGIVSFGILYWDIFDTLPYIYPTFTKAENITITCELEKTGKGIKCLTPRIELTTENGYFTNLFEFVGRIEAEKNRITYLK